MAVPSWLDSTSVGKRANANRPMHWARGEIRMRRSVSTSLRRNAACAIRVRVPFGSDVYAIRVRRISINHTFNSCQTYKYKPSVPPIYPIFYISLMIRRDRLPTHPAITPVRIRPLGSRHPDSSTTRLAGRSPGYTPDGHSPRLGSIRSVWPSCRGDRARRRAPRPPGSPTRLRSRGAEPMIIGDGRPHMIHRRLGTIPQQRLGLRRAPRRRRPGNRPFSRWTNNPSPGPHRASSRRTAIRAVAPHLSQRTGCIRRSHRKHSPRTRPARPGTAAGSRPNPVAARDRRSPGSSTAPVLGTGHQGARTGLRWM